MQIGAGPLRVRGGREDEAPVVGEDLEPGCEVARMIGARLKLGDDTEIGADEASAQIRDQLFASAFTAVAMIAREIPVEPVLRACPVAVMPISA